MSFLESSLSGLKNYIAKFRDIKDPATRLAFVSAAISFLSVALVGYSLSYYLSYQAKSQNANITSRFVDNYVKTHFKKSDFADKDGTSALLNETGKTSFLRMKESIELLEHVKVFDSAGRIIWSDNEALIGNFSSNKKFKKVLEGEPIYSFIKINKAGEHSDEGTDAFSVYVPIRFSQDGDVDVVFEVYKKSAGMARNIYWGWMFIWIFAISGGAIIHFIFVNAIKRASQQNLVLQQELVEHSQELEETIQIITEVQNVAILGLSKLAESRDKETGAHLERISMYSKLLAAELSKWDAYKFYITKNYVDSIFTSSVLHDIGKVGIPDAVLLKPGALTDEEFAIMKTHTTIGGDALTAADKELGIESFLTMGKEVAYYHHEKFNGRGYPFGKVGDDIPLSARIVALADVFDAVVSARVYKPAFDFSKAKEILLQGSGTHFDPNIVKAFLKIEKSFRDVLERYKV